MAIILWRVWSVLALLTALVWLYVKPGFESWTFLTTAVTAMASCLASHPIRAAAYSIVTIRVFMRTFAVIFGTFLVGTIPLGASGFLEKNAPEPPWLGWYFGALMTVGLCIGLPRACADAARYENVSSAYFHSFLRQSLLVGGLGGAALGAGMAIVFPILEQQGVLKPSSGHPGEITLGLIGFMSAIVAVCGTVIGAITFFEQNKP